MKARRQHLAPGRLPLGGELVGANAHHVVVGGARDELDEQPPELSNPGLTQGLRGPLEALLMNGV